MTPSELQLENDTLKQQLVVALAAIADRDAALADRAVKIEKLAHDLATLEAAVKRLLASRRGGYRVPEGQGLLFPAASIASEVSAATATNVDNEADDGSGEDVSGRGWLGRRSGGCRSLASASGRQNVRS